MHVRAISIPDVSPADVAAWRELAARSLEPNPFYEAEFLVPAARHLRSTRNVALLVAEEKGCFHACIPVHNAVLSRAPRLPVVSSWRHLYGLLGTPLLAPDNPLESIRSLLGTLRGSGPVRRLTVLELFGDDGPTGAYLRAAAAELGLRIRVQASWERAVFGSQDDGVEKLPKSVKHERRSKARQWQRLCRDLGEPVVVDRAPDANGAVTFLSVESSGWKGRAGTAMACRGADAAFYREVASRFGEMGRLRLYALELGDETLAMQTDLCAGGAMFDWKVAYDERFARYGPGTQLQLSVIERAQADGVRWIDSCSDDEDEHQLRLSAGRRRIVTLVIGGRGRAAGAASNLAVLDVKARRRVRERPRGASHLALRQARDSSARLLQR